MKKLIIVLTGIVLATAVIATGKPSLTHENLDIYERAVAIDGSVTGFANFSLTDYPVAFYDGEYDYVLTWENDAYRIDRRTPVINSVAATAYPVEDHYEVLAPTVEKMSSVLGIISMGEAKYNTEEQVSTIWHDAFHCWQFTNFEDNIDKIYSGIIDENTISQSVDANTQAAEMLADQLTILKETIKCEDVDKMRENIVKYKQLDTQRKELLTENITQLEDYYTIVEGTAFYVESCIYRSELPNKYMSVYIDDIDEYKGGAAKYYHMGMAQCMILDKLNSEWKTNYRFSESLMEMIYEELEI